MQGRQEITVRGAPPALESWVEGLSDPAVEGWSRGTEIERRRRLRPEYRWPICLIWSGEGRHPRTVLFLGPVSDTEIEVSNIVPIGRNRLDPNDRQAVLDAFRDALIVPRGVELAIEDKPLSAELPYELSADSSARFKTFVKIAEKTNLHDALGMTRWYDFLFRLHLDKNRPRRDVLEAGLRDEAFSEEVIDQLMKLYDFAGGFLRRYDEFREDR